MIVHRLITFLVLIALGPPVFAGVGPSSFSYEGRLYDQNGNPSADTVSFKMQILAPAQDCVMYEESFTAKDLSLSKGLFSLELGKGSASVQYSTSLSAALRNDLGAHSLASCAYSLNDGDGRRVKILVNDGSSVDSELSPTLSIGAAAYAMSANDVQGKAPGDFVQVNTAANLSQTNLEGLFTGSGFATLSDLAAGKFIPSSSTSGAALPVVNGSPASPQAGSIWYDSSTGLMKYRDGSVIQTIRTTTGSISEAELPTVTTAGKISGSAITSGTIAGTTAIATTGNIQTSGTITANRLYLYDNSGATPGSIGLLTPTVASSYTLTLPASQGAAGQQLTNNGSGILYWSSPLNAVTATAPLASGKIWVGGAGGTAQEVSLSGDATLSNTGALSLNNVPVAKGGTGLSALGSTGQILSVNTGGTGLEYANVVGTGGVSVNRTAGTLTINGTSGSVTSVDIGVPSFMTTTGGPITANGTITLGYAAQTAGAVFAGPASGSAAPNFRALSIADVKSSVSGNFLNASGACSAGQMLTYSSVTDNLSCAGFSLTTSQVTTSLGYTPQPAGNYITNLSGDVTSSAFTSGSVTTTVANVGIDKVSSGTGKYFTYQPNGSGCTDGQILKWNLSGARWECGISTVTETDPTVSAFAKNAPSSDFTTSGGTLTLAPVSIAKGGTGLTALPTSGQILIGNGSGYSLGTLTAGSGVSIANSPTGFTITAAGSGGTVTNVSGTAPVSVATGTTAPVISMAKATSSLDGYLSASDYANFNTKLGSSSVFAGDVSGTSSSTSVDKIKGSPLSIASPATGQYLKYSAGNWINASIDAGDIASGTLPTIKGGTGLGSIGTANQILGVNPAATGLEYKSITAGTGVTITPSAGTLTIASTGSGGTVTNVTSANTDIAVATGSTAPVLTLNSGTSANQIVKLDASAKLPAVDGSQLTNLSTGSLSGAVPVSKGGTGATTLGNHGVVLGQGTTAVVSTIGAAGTVLQGNGPTSDPTFTATPVHGVNGSITGTLGLANGAASGAITLLAPSSATTAAYTFTLPPNGGTAGYVLKTDGTGVTSWSASANTGNVNSATANQLAYYSATGTTVGGLASANSSVLTTNSSGVPTWTMQTADTFSQYALLAGRAGGQSIKGGTAANENLTLDSTASATKGNILLATSGGNVGIATSVPLGLLDLSTTAMNITPSATAGFVLNTSGSGAYPNDSSTAANGTVAGLNFYYLKSRPVTASSSNVTTIQATTLGLTGPPIAGVNETFTNASAIYIASGLISNGGNAINGYGIYANAPTGANNNYAATFMGGNVGIGTASPSTRLQVAGSLMVGDGAEACGASYAGTIRYNTGNLQFCNGTGWQTLGVAGGGITALTGDVTASGTGSVAATVAKVNGVSYPSSAAANTVPVVSATNTVTYQQVPNAALANSSVTLGSTNVALGNTVSSVSGLTSLGLGVGGTTTGQVTLANGAASGAAVTLQNNAATSAYNFNLPATPGTAGYALVSGGGAAAPMTWAALPSASGSSSITTVGTVTSGTWNASTVTVPYGGTGSTSLTAHGVLIGQGTGAVTSNLAAASGTMLQGNGATLDPTFTASPVLGVTGTTIGSIGLANSTTGGGTTTIKPSTSTVSAYTFTLPSGGGTAGYILQTNGSGITSWTAPASGTFTPSLSSVTAAAATNTIDNLNFAQTWNWSTATTQVPLTLTANSLTTGTALNVTSSSASLNSTTGLLTVANTGGSTNGTVARIQANSTAGSGLIVLANGNVGIGTATPAVSLDVYGGITARAGSTFAGMNTIQQIVTNSGTAGVPAYGFGYSSGTGLFETAGGSQSIGLSTAGAERVRFTSTGLVGIGTTTPATKLDVAGTLRIADGGETCTTSANGGMLKYTGSSLQYCNGAGWQTVTSSALGGINSLNGLNANTQTFANGTAGTAPAFSSATSTHTLNIPMASASGVTAGLLSNTDYTNLSGTVPVSRGGTGLTTTPANGQMLIGNGTGFSLSNLTAGTGLSISSGAGSVTVSAGTIPAANGGTGANSLTAGSLLVGNGTGAVTTLASGTAKNLLYGGTGGNSWTSGTADAAGVVDKTSLQTIAGTKTFSNEIVGTNATANTGQARFTNSSYGVVARNDNSSFYLLMTNSGDPNGMWTNARPLTINLATGNINFGGNGESTTVGGSFGVTGTAYFNNKVGIGTSNPVGTFVVQKSGMDLTSNTTSGMIIQDATQTDRRLHMGYDLSRDVGYIEATRSGVTPMPLILQPSGSNVGIGVLNPTYQLQLSTDSAAKPGTSTWTIASDERLKDIRAPFTRGLDALLGINTIYFRYKTDNALGLPSDKEFVGIRAQDAAKVVPEAVSTDEKGYLHVTNDSIIWTAVNAIKELAQRFTTHDREIAALKVENAKLKSDADRERRESESKIQDLERRMERLERSLTP